jgi:DNA mismatch endonuclease (patch repair protein)
MILFLPGSMKKRQKEVTVPRFTGSASSEAASRVKQRTPSRDTHPEVLLRRALWARGMRYRTDLRALAGRPDIVFVRARVVVFCDGDFWHGKDWPSRKRKLLRGANSAYWTAKIESNIRRDRRTTSTLRTEGWVVLRYWESAIKSDVASIVELIANAVHQQLTHAGRPGEPC